jgi:nucleoside phosphorylase
MPSQDEIAHQLKLLGIRRKTLKHYIEQQVTLGNFTPPYVTHGIDETRIQIRRIKSILRGWGATFEDHPDDEEQQPEPVSTTRVQSEPPAASEQAADDGLPYDIYISYHPADKIWVRNTLLPQLEGAGLRVIVDYRDFAIGRPKLVNIEQAVDQSRHTLIVMTPEWVDGEWQIFQSLLAKTSDPAGRRAKLLPLMLKPCTPPQWIDHLTPIDLTDEAERGEQIDRLLRSLAGQPARDIGSAMSQALKAAVVQGGTATVDQRSQNQVDGPALRRLLIANFNDKELHELCDDLSIDYEDLAGQTKSEKARELVAYATRRGRMDELISQARNLRPHADWQSVGVAGAPAPAKSSGRVTEPVAQPASSDATEQQVDFLIIAPLREERNAILSKLPGAERVRPSHTDVRVYYTAHLQPSFSKELVDSYSIVVTSPNGMGRVEAANLAGDAISRWRPRYVLLVGIAGGAATQNDQPSDSGTTGGVAAKGVRLGDVLIAESIVDYELQKRTAKKTDIRWKTYTVDQRLLPAAQNFDEPSWQQLLRETRPEEGAPKVHFGPIASGDKVIAYGKALDSIRDVWSKLIGVEMEAGGVALRASQTAQPPGFFMIRGISDLADQQKGSEEVERWRAYACDVAAAYTIGLLKSGPVPLGKS